MGADPVDLLVTVVVLALAAYRITRLVVLDDVIGEWPGDEHPRGTFVRKAIDLALYDDTSSARSKPADYVGKLYSCTFCVGWWVSMMVVCGWFRLWPHELGVDGWLVVFAVAGAQGYVSSRHQA
jgi:hypothetical protein